MLFSVEKLPNEPIMFTVLGDEYSIAADVEKTIAEIHRVLDTCTEKVYSITDITHLSFNATDVVYGANAVTRQFQVLKHPKIIENIIITQNSIMKLAADGVNRPIFGNIKVQVFATAEEAFVYVRGKIAEQT